MMGTSSYKTLGIGKDTHARLKSLAKGSAMPITAWLDQVVGYFYRMGLSPEDLGSEGENRAIQGMKKQVDYLVKLIKSQEKKLLMPISQTVLELQYQMQEVGTWVDMTCPVCKGDYRQFALEEEFLVCGNCELRFRIVFGKTQLNEVDVITLLSGGMTRQFENLTSPEGKVISCRFYLDDKEHYTLKMQQ